LETLRKEGNLNPNILFLKAPSKLLNNCIDGRTKTQVARESKLTYSHVSKATNELEELELISISSKDNRSSSVSLTKKGNTVLNHINKIKELIRENV